MALVKVLSDQTERELQQTLAEVRLAVRKLTELLDAAKRIVDAVSTAGAEKP